MHIFWNGESLTQFGVGVLIFLIGSSVEVGAMLLMYRWYSRQIDKAIRDYA